jgi:hypothetical protein
MAMATRLLVLCALAPVATALCATDDDSQAEHIAVIEVAAAGEREISEHAFHVGPAVGVEIEPIANWLEIELGASAYRSRGATSWEFELPFKKPFRLTSTIEIMPGLGPTWAHSSQPSGASSNWGAETVIDIFFWQSKQLGWYLEPSYGVTFGNGNKTSASLTVGLFFAVP